MPDTTPIFDWPVPVLGDDPNGPAQITALADAIETTVSPIAAMPTGDPSNSVQLNSGAILLTGSATTDILVSTFTLTRQQYVFVAGKARLEADSTSGASGEVGIRIIVDGAATDLGYAGPIHISQYGVDPGDRRMLSIPMFSVLLAAGSHTVKLQGNRDGSNKINATSTGTALNINYHPTSLTVIV